MKSIESLKKKLSSEGYKDVYVWEDTPNTNYDTHFHRTDTKIIILDGEMILTLNGETKKLKVGDEVEIEKNEKHSAKIGKKRCKYLVGEK